MLTKSLSGGSDIWSKVSLSLSNTETYENSDQYIVKICLSLKLQSTKICSSLFQMPDEKMLVIAKTAISLHIVPIFLEYALVTTFFSSFFLVRTWPPCHLCWSPIVDTMSLSLSYLTIISSLPCLILSKCSDVFRGLVSAQRFDNSLYGLLRRWFISSNTT